MDNEIQVQNSIEQVSADVKPKIKPWWKKINRRIVLIIVVVVILSGAVYYFRSLLFVASVNGRLISRFSVIGELEKKSGKQALDYLITQKIIEDAIKKSGVAANDEDVNSEISKISASIELQGSTLAATLALQKMTEDDLKKQVIIQKEIEKILADKIAVTDAEVASYIEDNKITFSKDQNSVEATQQIKDGLQREKFNNEVNLWLTDLKAKAKINYFIEY